MIEFEIEKGIPLPGKKYLTSPLKTALDKLEVGDSFLYPLANRTSIAPCAARVPGKKFTSRKVDNENVRVWRVK